MFTENFHGTLENCKNSESLAQQILPHLWYILYVSALNFTITDMLHYNLLIVLIMHDQVRN